jgi:tRNA 2-thiouridine synthesizing protein E
MAYECNGVTIEADEEGYIADVSLWNQELAGMIAESENIEMNDDHWEVVNFLRNFYEEYQIEPAARILTRAVKKTLGPEKGNSKYLYELFPFGPIKQASKIAGLPKPTSCI